MSARSQVGVAQCVQPKSLPGFYLRPDAARALDRACEKFGKNLIISGALRSYETQRAIFVDRYKVQWVGGGYYGDVRWWKGKRYVRQYGTAAAAVPGTSNHGSGDAIDVKTSRSKGDPGHAEAVTFTGWSDPDRAEFLRVAAEFGWSDAEGRAVNEVWHITYYPELDKHRGSGAPSGGASKPSRPASKPKPATKHAKVKKLQRAAHVKADGVWGPKTDEALHCIRWASAHHGSRHPNGVRDTQRAVGVKADGVWGPKSRAAHDRAVKKVQRALGVRADGIWGSATDRAFVAAWNKYRI